MCSNRANHSNVTKEINMFTRVIRPFRVICDKHLGLFINERGMQELL